MNLFSLRRRCRLPGSDGPYRLIGNDDTPCGPLAQTIEAFFHLSPDDLKGRTLLSLPEGLSHTEYRDQVMIERPVDLPVDPFVRLAKILAALAVAYYNILAAAVQKHCGRYLAGVSALLF